MLKDRRFRLQPFFESANADAILVTNPLSIRYLCGFSGSESALLLTADSGWFFCDSRYTTQAEQQVKDLAIIQFNAKFDSIASIITDEKFSRVACEGEHLVVADFIKLSKKLTECSLVAIEESLAVIRTWKSAEEIEQLSQVADISSASLHQCMPLLVPGISEKEFARELEFAMRRNGADGIAFEFIVASGDRGSMPHGVASDKIIHSGELVTIDFGAIQNGYHSDETVTIAIGYPAAEMIKIHQIVKEAHDLAITSVKPGISCRELDSVSRNFIKQKGYGDYFGHGLGHGVGLEIHEKPVISPRSDAIVEVGMVFTIEPGIYLPGKGGVRIEDTVVVTETGCKTITKAPKNIYYH